jgi:predicted CoA-binding protein
MGEVGWKGKVNGILERCRAEGRVQLYEHEIYEILGLLGMDLPVHYLVRSAGEITASLLARFGSGRIVVKVVSPKIAHKERLGGVKIVVKDVDFVRYTFERMREEIGGAGYPVEGALLVEFVEYSRDLGNEILLGFRQTETFGPVLSFSKGGSDAEHFAAHFSPPNLLLPPIDRKWAMASIASTHISKKYAAEGRQGCAERIVDTKIALGKLCVAFSDFFESESPFVLKEFEINPFVFDADGRFLPLDGYGVIGDKRAAAGMEAGGDSDGGAASGGAAPGAGLEGAFAGKESLDPFFIPDGIAVVGVSATDNAKAGNEIVKNLLELGRDDVYGVNPRGGSAEICGRSVPLFQSVSALPSAVDLAVITVPADAALPVVEDCVRAGVKGILIISGGFSETSKNDELERRILELTRRGGSGSWGPTAWVWCTREARNGRGSIPSSSRRRSCVSTSATTRTWPSLVRAGLWELWRSTTSGTRYRPR